VNEKKNAITGREEHYMFVKKIDPYLGMNLAIPL